MTLVTFPLPFLEINSKKWQFIRRDSHLGYVVFPRCWGQAGEYILHLLALVGQQHVHIPRLTVAVWQTHRGILVVGAIDGIVCVRNDKARLWSGL